MENIYSSPENVEGKLWGLGPEIGYSFRIIIIIIITIIIIIINSSSSSSSSSSMGRNISVGIATRYRLDGPRIETWWGRDFPHLSRPALGPTSLLLYNGYRVFPGGKAAGAWR